jgi:hypothetical protein
MSSFDLLHFDTNDNNCIFNGLYGNAYDVNFKLSNTFKRIRKINLASLEMPISFTNIRNENTSNVLNLIVGSVPYNITLRNTNYTSITTLITDINALLASTGTVATRPVLSIGYRTSNNNCIQISIPSPNTIQLFDSVLANNIFGFPKNVYNRMSAPVSNILGTYSYNLSYDNFIALYLNIPSTCTSSGNHLISYKIPLNAISGMVYYLGQNNTFEQSIVISDQSFVLNDFRIQVFDRFGYPIIQATDYTFSLSLYYY